MSRIREVINALNTQAAAGANSIENSYLRTTERLLVSDSSKALLPSVAIGDIVWNLAMIFKDNNTMVIEQEVTVTTDGKYVVFDDLDDVKGMYCIVSYLTYKV